VSPAAPRLAPAPPGLEPDPGPAGRVLVGLSGGVDSAVATLLLQRAGYRVATAFLKSWEEDDQDGRCSAAADLAAAEAVARHLGVPLARVNLAAEYWDRVFEGFLEDCRAGLTPNPDIACNREIKFRAFLDHALGSGAERIATGHYARIARRGGRYRLLRGADPDKDQSYFLYALDQRALARAVFPLGTLTKREVRRIAAEAGLPNHARPGSTGICFIGERAFRPFLERFVPPSPGEIQTPDGEVLGRHQGLPFYTLGQRKGLGIGGHASAGSRPWFVLAKDTARNVLVVAQGHDHPALLSPALLARAAHWVSGDPPAGPFEAHARVRYRQPDQACRVTPLGDGQCRVDFAEPQRAVAPGQSVVFYRAEECLGGAVIERGLPSAHGPCPAPAR
jgi:tRNA-specific 2-thiouridylase